MASVMSDQIQILHGPGPGETRTDAALLDAFVLTRDEAAFAELVRRHSSLVWGVCRRTLGSSHDAEDAFQATFLVLVKKADTVWPRAMVGNWLYGVAHRTALKAKSAAARRQAREKQGTRMAGPHTQPDPSGDWSDVMPTIDREIGRLADKYRAAVVLCDVEGVSQRDAARQLGWAEGTLTTRLMRARQMLAHRLTRQGVALSTGGLTAFFATQASAAPATLVINTIHSATLVAAGTATAAATSAPVAALTEGVLKAMFLTKIKTVAAVLLAVAIVVTGGLVAHRSFAGRAAEPAPPIVQRLVDYDFTLFQEREGAREAAGREAAGRDGGRDGRPANPPSLFGRVVAVSADGATLETPPANRGDEPVRKDVKFDAKTKFTFSAVGPDGAKVAEGQMMQVWLAEGDKVAATVNVQGNQGTNRSPDLQGRVFGISKDGNTITFQYPPKERGEEPKTVDIKITPKTVVTYSNIAKGSTRPAEGYGAQVWYEKGSTDTAAAISFGGNDGPERGRFERAPVPSGKVVGVAKDGKSITIETPPQNRGEEPGKIDIKIAGTTKVVFFNVIPGGDDISEGQFARVWLADNSKDTADTILLAAQQKSRFQALRGQVKDLAKDGKSFSLETPPTERGGEPKANTIKISDATRVVFMGVPKDGARAEDGYLAEVSLEEGSLTNAVQVIFHGPQGRGGGSR